MKTKIVFKFLFLSAVFCVMFFLTPILFPAVAGVSLAGIMLNGPYGNYTGKVGGTIAAMWKGINYLKAYVIPANPNTVGQQAQRTKFKNVILLAQNLIPTLITTFWNPFAVGMSGFNAFVKNIFPNVSSTGFITSACQVTKGTLEGIAEVTATYNSSTGETSVAFSAAFSGNGLATDNINLLLLRLADNQIVGYSFGAAERADEGATFTAHSGETATGLVCFIWASRGTGLNFIVSNSGSYVCTTP